MQRARDEITSARDRFGFLRAICPFPINRLPPSLPTSLPPVSPKVKAHFFSRLIPLGWTAGERAARRALGDRAPRLA